MSGCREGAGPGATGGGGGGDNVVQSHARSPVCFQLSSVGSKPHPRPFTKWRCFPFTEKYFPKMTSSKEPLRPGGRPGKGLQDRDADCGLSLCWTYSVTSKMHTCVSSPSQRENLPQCWQTNPSGPLSRTEGEVLDPQCSQPSGSPSCPWTQGLPPPRSS